MCCCEITFFARDEKCSSNLSKASNTIFAASGKVYFLDSFSNGAYISYLVIFCPNSFDFREKKSWNVDAFAIHSKTVGKVRSNHFIQFNPSCIGSEVLQTYCSFSLFAQQIPFFFPY